MKQAKRQSGSPGPGDRASHWWGDYRLDEAQGLRCAIGSLRLAVERRGDEWLVAWEIGSETGAEAASLCTVDGLGAGESYPNSERYLFQTPREILYLRPLLADRPVVSRPTVPFQLPAGEDTVIFVSSPVWVRLEVGEPRARLSELPVQRPSDTWFGASTREGELCYATKTSARRFLHEVPARPHRAVTPVQIRNRAQTPLRLDRISLPTPYLRLYSDSRGMLWTQAITLRREEGSDLAALAMEHTPPREAEGAVVLSEPRQTAGKNILVRAFGALFD